jgi:hypothetical protein
MDYQGIISFNEGLSHLLEIHLQKSSILSEVRMPGTSGHIHPHLYLRDKKSFIIASVAVFQQNYDFIEITTHTQSNGIDCVWINYLINVKTGEKRNLISSELNENVDGRVWRAKSKLSQKDGIFTEAMRSRSKDVRSEGTLASKLNSDRRLMEAIQTLVVENINFDVYPSSEFSCCTISQSIKEEYWPSKEELNIVGMISKNIRDFVPMTF